MGLMGPVTCTPKLRHMVGRQLSSLRTRATVLQSSAIDPILIGSHTLHCLPSLPKREEYVSE